MAGKLVLVTGGARNVGKAIAARFAARGAHVIINFFHSLDESKRTAAALRDAGGQVDTIRASVAQKAQVDRMFDEIEAKYGRLDILVNNAAGYARTPLVTMDDDAWDAMFALNLDAPMRLMREAARAGASAIVNIVDVAAWQPWGSWSAYATTKAALLHLSRCLALELAPRTRVNCVAPGTVIFPDDWDEARRARQLAKVPLARAGSPEDVARAVRFLCEEEFLTGVCIPVDGGAGLR
jgi:NAD(P)-dependent dehydrogenase (short-subunit alcohol dehydrogenase family)